MQRVLATLILLALPTLASAQALSPASPRLQQPAVAARSTANDESASDFVVPLFRAPDGRLLALVADDSQLTGPSRPGGTPSTGSDLAGTDLSFRLVDATSFLSTGLRWNFGNHLYTRADVNQARLVVTSPNACGPAGVSACGAGSETLLEGGALGGGYHAGPFNLDVGASWLQPGPAGQAQAPALLRNQPLLHNQSLSLPTVGGLPLSDVDSLSGLSARSSLDLGETSRVSLGASIGRVRLLPEASALGYSSIDQAALSLGVGSGPLKGVIVGRVMQPLDGAARIDPTQRWSAVDLGVTLRLPWQGELSVGAQNLWSSGQTPAAATQQDPAQDRIPYIQYHQEL